MRLEQEKSESHLSVQTVRAYRIPGEHLTDSLAQPLAPPPSTPTPLPNRQPPSTRVSSIGNPSFDSGSALSPSAPVASPPSSADAPPSSLPDRLSRMLQQPEGLPTGLLALLEACVEEGERGGPETTSVLATKVGLVGGKSTEPKRVAMPPPPVPTRLHKRSVSSPSVLSVVDEAGEPAPADTRDLERPGSHGRGLASQARTRIRVLDALAPIPRRPHPAYPPNFARPLQFVHETGAARISSVWPPIAEL